VASARPIAGINYDEMLELAALGASVLHYRAAELARRFKVPLRLASSFGDAGETMVDETVSMERAKATGVTCNEKVISARISAKSQDELRALIERITTDDVRVLCYHRQSTDSACTVHLVTANEDADAVTSAIDDASLEADIRTDLGSVSIVGSGLAANTATVFEIEKALADASIPVAHTEKSALSVTCLVPRSDCKRAVETLHSKFIENA
jgi:aspartate kinase